MGGNGLWSDLGPLTRAFKKQEKVIIMREFLARTAFNLKG